VPSSWEKFKVRRRFRRANYDIEVTNPNHVNRGISEIIVDGKKWNSHLLPDFADGKTHKVEVLMGEENCSGLECT